MELTIHWIGSRRMAAGLAGLIVLLAGCATQVDWAARVGHYSYDQAVTEMGPPSRFAKLTDGSEVADWLTQRGQTIVSPAGGAYYPYRGGWVGAAGPSSVVYTTPNYYLRLSFDPAGKLKSWKTIQQ
jgi:hypothetical protein